MTEGKKLGKLEEILKFVKKYRKEILTAVALPLVFATGVRAIDNSGELIIYDIGSGDVGGGAMNIVHHDGTPRRPSSEGKDDLDYMWSKYVEFVNGYIETDSWLGACSSPYEIELQTDTRPANSTSTVDIELRVVHKQGGEKQISCSNYLKLEFVDIQGSYPNFNNQPITFWKQDANDPNLHYLTANVRKEILQNEGVIPLEPLNGTYQSEEPYLKGWIRFDTPFVHLNNDNIVDLKDFAVFANALGRTGITNINRADPSDRGAWADYDLDEDVDIEDLSTFSDYYLTSKTYHLENGWVIDANDENP